MNTSSSPKCGTIERRQVGLPGRRRCADDVRQNHSRARPLAEFAEAFTRALKANDLYFILAKVEPGAGEVPAAALDSQENKYLFVRYIEKSENVKIIVAGQRTGPEVNSNGFAGGQVHQDVTLDYAK